MYFQNRLDAARQLLPYLKKYTGKQAVVFAVPRGGVPMGKYLAEQLNLPFDLVLTKKIGHPYNREYAVGAVSPEGVILNEQQEIPAAYLEEEVQRIRKKLQERYSLFFGNREMTKVEGKTVILVDDGIATGYTLRATLSFLRKKNPVAIVVAVPVAPLSTAKQFRNLADEFICLHTPADFYGVGQYYEDFSEVTDEEVVEILKTEKSG